MPRIPNWQTLNDNRRNFLKITGLMSATAFAGVTLANSAQAATPVAKLQARQRYGHRQVTPRPAEDGCPALPA